MGSSSKTAFCQWEHFPSQNNTKCFIYNKYVYNICIGQKINIRNSALDYIRYKQVNWYGHVRRIDEERLPQHFNGVLLEEEEREDLEICGCK